MKLNNKFYIFLFLAVAETVAIFWYSFLPVVDFVETGFLRLGDLEHLIAYSVYGLLLQRVSGYFLGRKQSVILSILIGSVVGGMSEVVQHVLPYRTGDMIDWAVDILGSAIGGTLSAKFKPYSQID